MDAKQTTVTFQVPATLTLKVGRKGEVPFNVEAAVKAGLDFGAVFKTGLERIVGDRVAGDDDTKGAASKVAAWEKGEHRTGGGAVSDAGLNVARSLLVARTGARGAKRNEQLRFGWDAIRTHLGKDWEAFLKDLNRIGVTPPTDTK